MPALHSVQQTHINFQFLYPSKLKVVGQIKQSVLVEVQVGIRQPHVQFCNEETKGGNERGREGSRNRKA